LDVFHDCSIIFPVRFWCPWVFEVDASVDMMQELSEVINLRCVTPWDGTRFF